MDRQTLHALGEKSPYFNYLGMMLEDCGKGWARLRMAVRPQHMNFHGVVHGGVISSLADQTAMRALQTLLSDGRAASTVQMDTHFLAPARGEALLCRGAVRKMGGKTAFVDADVYDEHDHSLALARCTIMILESRRGRES